MKLLILSDEPINDYEKVSFTTIQFYCETNNYDLMYRIDYKSYNNDYDFLIYISNNCLITNISIKLEKIINKKHIIDTFTDDDNCVNFLIIKNCYDSIKILNNLYKYKQIYNINKNIKYLSFNESYEQYHNDLKDPLFQKKINNYFFFIYDKEKQDKHMFINNIILNYIYNQILNIIYFKKNYIDINIDYNIYDYTKNKETFNDGNDIAFVTLYTPNMRNIGFQMEYNMKTYCLKNNYTFYIHRINEIELEPNLLKPIIINQYLKSHKYVIWIDADILCFDMNFKIENILNNYSLQCFKDITHFCNTAFLIFKNDNISIEILNDWTLINKCIKPKTDKEFIRFINNKYIDYTFRNNTNEINIPLYYLNKNTKFIHFKMHSFNRILLMEYFNYIIFNLK